MRLLIIDAESFSYSPQLPSMKTSKSNRRQLSYDNCLVVFIAFESNDKQDRLKKVAKEIARQYRLREAMSVVIVPNVHLSSSILDEHCALHYYNILYDLIVHRGIKVYQEPFGNYGRWSITAKSHRKAVVGRSF